MQEEYIPIDPSWMLQYFDFVALCKTGLRATLNIPLKRSRPESAPIVCPIGALF